MSCPFYGKFAGVLTTAIVEQSGNQCAVVIHSHVPCVMEVMGREVDAKCCPLLETASLMNELYAMHARRASSFGAQMVDRGKEQKT